MTTFRDHTILVTGAASGLGRLMSRTMAAEGGRLVLWDVDAAGLQATRTELGASGASVATYVCDLSDRAAIRGISRGIERTVLVENGARTASGKVFCEEARNGSGNRYRHCHDPDWLRRNRHQRD